MRVSYKGTDTELKCRLAEIGYNDDEETIVRRIAEVMEIRGYSIDMVADGYAQCVVDDRNDYNEFMKEWKACKKSVKLWTKFGF